MTSVLRLALFAALAAPAFAQVDYGAGGAPWKQRAKAGPDAECPGWYYNLGVTGVRVELVAEAPTELVVRHVLAGAPAAGVVQVGDRIVGAGGARFVTPHRDGYGMDVFGPDGPILDFAQALDAALGSEGHVLGVTVRRGEQELALDVPLGAERRAYAASFPRDCAVAEQKFDALCDHLVAQQREDGSFGGPLANTFAPLALLASAEPAHRAAAVRNARWHAETTSTTDERHLVNWYYTSAAIVLAETYFATRDEALLPELREVLTFLHTTQYVDLSQLSPTVKESHPRSWPKGPMQQHGGWGHSPGFKGYGPIAMLTAQGALAYELGLRAGLDVDRERLAAAHAFLARGTGRNGYVWYADDVANHDGWADPGRTGAAAVAARLGGRSSAALKERAHLHAKLLGESWRSFPDTHGSPLMGMGYAALGALADETSFLGLLRANRWWFVLAECPDGTFHYQPNRDNAGYGADARLEATATVALILSLARAKLVVGGA